VALLFLQHFLQLVGLTRPSAGPALTGRKRAARRVNPRRAACSAPPSGSGHQGEGLAGAPEPVADGGELPGAGWTGGGPPQQLHAQGAQVWPAGQAGQAQAHPPPPPPVTGLVCTHAPDGQGAAKQAMAREIHPHELALSAWQLGPSVCAAQGSAGVGGSVAGGGQGQGAHAAPGGQAGQPHAVADPVGA
jgi:hypothetical protein